jgi:hypothetical protein
VAPDYHILAPQNAHRSVSLKLIGSSLHCVPITMRFLKS